MGVAANSFVVFRVEVVIGIHPQRAGNRAKANAGGDEAEESHIDAFCPVARRTLSGPILIGPLKLSCLRGVRDLMSAACWRLRFSVGVRGLVIWIPVRQRLVEV